jgi:hypothetical protein
MSLTKVLLASAWITVCAAALPCYATTVPSSSVQLSIPAKYFGRAMISTFTPPGGLTLKAYAAQLGYSGFDWTQKITNWANPDLHKFGDGSITAPTAFPDPPVGGYTYNPCGSNASIGGGAAPGAAARAAPFYFSTATQDQTTMQCWSVLYNETPRDPATAITLSFGDEPMDPELTSTQISANDVPKFLTSLVGICPSANTTNGCKSIGASSPLFAWTWQSTYNGTSSSGGVATTANSPDFDSGVGGTGGVTITGICHILHGEAQPGCEGHGGDAPAMGASARVPVPEPPGSLLLASGVLAILAVQRMIRSKRV